MVRRAARRAGTMLATADPTSRMASQIGIAAGDRVKGSGNPKDNEPTSTPMPTAAAHGDDR